MVSARAVLLSVLALGLPVTAAAAAASAPPSCSRHLDVRSLMTVTQFEQSGLEGLTKQQLAALNQWLSSYVQSLCTGKKTRAATTAKSAPPPTHKQAPANASAAVAAFGNPPSHRVEPNRIESHIVGEFHGWTGNTVFHLANGQVWEQAGPGYFQTDLKSPKVVIKKLLIGYVLLVHGYAKEVFVRRIR